MERPNGKSGVEEGNALPHEIPHGAKKGQVHATWPLDCLASPTGFEPVLSA